MSSEKFNFIFQQYPETVQLSSSRRAKYWKEGRKVNKTIQERIDKEELVYILKSKHLGKCLYDLEKKEFVVSNPKQVGTPRIVPINGQYLWDGSLSEWYNRAVKEQLKAYFVPALIRQNIVKLFPPKYHFIQFEYIFYFPFLLRSMTGHKCQDYFNHAILYMKCFEDILQEEGWLENDNPDIVRGGYARYVEIGEEAERRMEIKVHFCRNKERIT